MVACAARSSAAGRAPREAEHVRPDGGRGHRQRESPPSAAVSRRPMTTTPNGPAATARACGTPCVARSAAAGSCTDRSTSPAPSTLVAEPVTNSVIGESVVVAVGAPDRHARRRVPTSARSSPRREATGRCCRRRSRSRQILKRRQQRGAALVQQRCGRPLGAVVGQAGTTARDTSATRAGRGELDPVVAHGDRFPAEPGDVDQAADMRAAVRRTARCRRRGSRRRDRAATAHRGWWAMLVVSTVLRSMARQLTGVTGPPMMLPTMPRMMLVPSSFRSSLYHSAVFSGSLACVTSQRLRARSTRSPARSARTS